MLLLTLQKILYHISVLEEKINILQSPLIRMLPYFSEVKLIH